jgi:hypothetical protein
MSLRLNGSASGYVEIDAPATAGSNTLILPDGNGTANHSLVNDGSGNLSWFNGGPAFSAYLDGTQTISLNTFTKIQFNAEEFDTASCYDSSTNYRFQPNVAGYYSCNFLTSFFSTTSAGRNITAFYKNGNETQRMHDLQLSFGATRITYNGTQLIYLDGSTDYVEVYLYSEGSNTITVGSVSSTQTCYFQAHLARPA